MFNDPDRAIVPGPAEPFRMMLEPHSRTAIDCSIPRFRLPEDALGYAYHFHGTSRSGLKVEASVYFEYFVYQASSWSRVAHPDAVELLEAVRAAAARSAPADVRTAKPAATLTSVRNFVEVMSPTWTREQRERYTTGLASILTTAREPGVLPLLDAGGDDLFLGKQCLQDEEPPSDNLVCKLTGQRGKVYVPSRIMNGKKGDVVLVPGGPLGFIGGLLGQMHPPQQYSHCGIMTSNFYKLRHSTASDEWLEDEIYGRTILAPDDKGTDGINPESLKFIWPGTIDQTVDEAFLGSFFAYTSQDGKRQKSYKIQAFSKDPVFFELEDRQIAFPLVVKPDPLLEGDPAFARLRPTLSQVAEKAKRINGHYRFFCYSNGAISFRDDTVHHAPDRGPTWWASGTRPTMCSSLVAAAVDDLSNDDHATMKVRLEGAGQFVTSTDLELGTPPDPPTDQDAEVDPLTRDGLYLYTEQDRRNAGTWLFNRVHAKVKEKSSGPLGIGEAFTDAADDFANQICNAFAYDYTAREFDNEDSKDSGKWQDPGVGRSVSPDDILRFWDRPSVATERLVRGLYGTAQRMVYRDSVFEEREIGRWAKREKIGKLIVTVRYQQRLISGADVKVGGQVVVTSPQGTAAIDLPEGRYEVTAGVFRNGLFFDGSLQADVKDRTDISVTLDLNDPPESFRIVVIGGHVRIKDEENFGKDEFVDETVGIPPLRVGPTKKQDGFTWIRKMGGEIRVEARFDLFWKPNLSVEVAYNVKLFEGTSEDTNDLDGQRGGVVILQKDQINLPLNVFVRNDDEDDDDYVDLKLQLSNIVDL